jgi:hypothetical protein
MSQGIFSPSGKSFILDYADDSTDLSQEIPAAAAVNIFNPDAANVVAVSFGFATDGDNNAFLPVGNNPGEGIIVGPGQQITVNLPQAAYITTNTMLVAVAGASATGNVYINLGSLQ